MPLSMVKWIQFPCKTDVRGTLAVVEGKELPFAIARFFYVHGMPSNVERGGHAHRATEQIVIAVTGSFRLDLTDGKRTQSYLLDDPDKGVYIPPMIWDRLYAFSPDAVCLVVASTYYSETDYIRDWDEFRRLTEAQA